MREIEVLYRKAKYLVQVDDADYSDVKKYNWYLNPNANGRLYVRGRYVKGTGKVKYTFLHRYLLNAPRGMLVDHIDGNPLNCQRSNLRLATAAQNAANVPKTKRKTSSQYKGVYWNRADQYWCTAIKVDGKAIYLGRTHFEVVAARVYDYWAKRIYGEFARLNAV